MLDTFPELVDRFETKVRRSWKFARHFAGGDDAQGKKFLTQLEATCQSAVDAVLNLGEGAIPIWQPEQGEALRRFRSALARFRRLVVELQRLPIANAELASKLVVFRRHSEARMIRLKRMIEEQQDNRAFITSQISGEFASHAS